MKLNNKISTIFFDAGGVLFDTKTSRNERIMSILKAKGFDNITIDAGLSKGEEFWEEFYESKQWLSNWKEEEVCWNKYYEVILREIDKNSSYSFQQQLLHHTHYGIHSILFKEVREIYNEACNRISVLPDDCIFIGDGGSDELTGAQAIGMKAYCANWFNVQFGYKPPHGFQVLQTPYEVISIIDSCI